MKPMPSNCREAEASAAVRSPVRQAKSGRAAVIGGRFS